MILIEYCLYQLNNAADWTFQYSKKWNQLFLLLLAQFGNTFLDSCNASH